MSNPEPMPEPSMEEILASIRQIITDGEEEGAPEEKAAEADAPEADDDVFDLTDEMVSEAPEPDPEPQPAPAAAAIPFPRPSDAGSDEDLASTQRDLPDDDELEFRAPAAPVAQPEPEPQEATVDEPAKPAAGDPAPAASQAGADPLLSAATGQAVAEAFGRLTTRSPVTDTRTIEELVVDMLRPMLKEWLDDNLPLLVERLVRDEIDRVTRGRR